MSWILWALGSVVAGYGAVRYVGPMITGPAPGVPADMKLDTLLNQLGLGQLFDDTEESAKFVTILEEGESLSVYRDTTGHRTIGIGFNMDAGNAQTLWSQAGVKTMFGLARAGTVPISKAESDALFRITFRAAEADARAVYPDYAKLGKWQKVALIGMVFQLGRGGVAKFTNTLAALRAGDAQRVYQGVTTSLWARQTPARALRAALMLANNKSHRDAEAQLVAQGLIAANQRKYA